MRVIFCGSRHWRNAVVIERVMTDLMGEIGEFEVISGGASGADKISEEVARGLGLSTRVVRAHWTLYGKKAGPIRNREMLALAPVRVVAFKGDFDHLLRSGGTENMVKIARKAGIRCDIHEREG